MSRVKGSEEAKVSGNISVPIVRDHLIRLMAQEDFKNSIAVKYSSPTNVRNNRKEVDCCG
jgi:hypothetical protein